MVFIILSWRFDNQEIDVSFVDWMKVGLQIAIISLGLFTLPVPSINPYGIIRGYLQ